MCSVFDLVYNEDIPLLRNPADAPESPGVYFLYDRTKSFIYVGKASSLRERITRHFSPNEENLKIKRLAYYYKYILTSTTDEAEILEGLVFDSWVRATGGEYPSANTDKPPRSALTDTEINTLRLCSQAIRRLIE
ncbi:MAG TPA: nucleotide excision repair endonuclease [Candidatus Fermentibacter daniensis]|nr:nucleotide excision repair endonuclease [Candidatus Fermentibacter daniensis]HQM41887.1 nucleotide excision repair endonuclease [Candidatus Fermentibacter daniensis]